MAEDLIAKYRKQRDAAQAQQAATEAAAGGETESWGHAAGDVGVGLVQGAILDPIEGGAQILEHVLPGAAGRAAGSVATMLPGMRERAGSTAYGEAGEFAGSILPYIYQPELGIGRALGAIPRVGRALRPMWTVFSRSTVPSVLQPVDPNDPNFGLTKGAQAVLGTGVGEALRGVGGAAARWMANRAAEKAAAEAAEQAARRGALGRVSQQAQQLAEHRVALGEHGRAMEQHAADLAKDAADRERALAQHQERTQATLTTNEAIEAHNQRVQNEVNRLNQRNEAEYRGQQVAAEIQRTRQAAIPAETTRDMYARIYTSVGEKPPDTIDWRTPGKTLRMVGAKLDGIYRRMSVDAGKDSELVPEFMALQAEALTDNLKGVPTGLRRQWMGYVRDLVIEPLVRHEGTLTGEALVKYTNAIRSKVNELGKLSGEGRFGSDYKAMSESLDEFLGAIEEHADAKNPQLAADRQAANLAYHMADNVDRASKPVNNGIFTPKEAIDAWRAKVGRRSFGSDARLADVKQHLIDRHEEHAAPIEKPVKPPTIKGPEPVPRREVSDVPKPPAARVPPKAPKTPRPLPAWRPPPAAPGPEPAPTTAADYAAQVAAHLVRAKTGIPVHVSRPALQRLARKATVAAPVVAPVRHVARPAAAITGYGVSGAMGGAPGNPLDVTVTAPRYRRSEESQQ